MLLFTSCDCSLLLGVGLRLSNFTPDLDAPFAFYPDILSFKFCYLSLFLEFFPLFGVGGFYSFDYFIDIFPGDLRSIWVVGMKCLVAFKPLVVIRGSELVETRRPSFEENRDETLMIWFILVSAAVSSILFKYSLLSVTYVHDSYNGFSIIVPFASSFSVGLLYFIAVSLTVYQLERLLRPVPVN